MLSMISIKRDKHKHTVVKDIHNTSTTKSSVLLVLVLASNENLLQAEG